jgi:hypothetical protein
VVQGLLEKIPAEMIGLSNQVYKVLDREGVNIYQGQRRSMREAAAVEQIKATMRKNKGRGKNTESKKRIKRKANIMDKAKQAHKKKLEQREVKRRKIKKTQERAEQGLHDHDALDRF